MAIKTKCIGCCAGTNDALTLTFCNLYNCCSTGPLQLTNGRQVGSFPDFPVFNCAAPDIFESSTIGNCQDFEFGPRSMVTGNITISGNVRKLK